MNSIEFTMSKDSKQHIVGLRKLQEFIGNKSIFMNSTNKVIIDIPIDKLKLSVNRQPTIEIDGDIDKVGSICTTYTDNNETLIQFKIGDKIGKGGYGTVYEGTLLGGISAPKEYIDKKIIIKVQSLYNSSNENVNLLKETLIHLILNSDAEIYRYIPKYIGTFRMDTKVGFMMQWAGKKTLSNKLEDDSFDNNNITGVLLQISKILELMQKKYSFIHGDLKPNNVMVYRYKNKSKKIMNESIHTYGYTIKIIDFGFTTMKTKKYIIKNHPYERNINDKFYIDLLFLSINVIRSLKKKNRTHMKIYKILDTIVSSLFEKIKLKFEYHIKINMVKQKDKKSLTNFFKIGMVEYVRKLDILYDIISMTLYIDNNNNNIFGDFVPQNFFENIRGALD
jgi:serine/threonine protein kinase